MEIKNIIVILLIVISSLLFLSLLSKLIINIQVIYNGLKWLVLFLLRCLLFMIKLIVKIIFLPITIIMFVKRYRLLNSFVIDSGANMDVDYNFSCV